MNAARKAPAVWQRLASSRSILSRVSSSSSKFRFSQVLPFAKTQVLTPAKGRSPQLLRVLAGEVTGRDRSAQPIWRSGGSRKSRMGTAGTGAVRACSLGSSSRGVLRLIHAPTSSSCPTAGPGSAAAPALPLIGKAECSRRIREAHGRSGSGWPARKRSAAASSMSELSASHWTARRMARVSRKAYHAGSRSGCSSWSTSLNRRNAPRP
jgi:hypothetical protein